MNKHDQVNSQHNKEAAVLAGATRPLYLVRKFQIVCVVCALVLACISAWIFIRVSQPDTARSLKHVSVRLSWLNQAQFAGMYVAKEQGYYRDAGLDVDFREYQDGVDANKELNDGRVDFAVTTPLELLTSLGKGAKIKAIAAVYQTSPYAIASPVASKITKPADFKGKTLGSAGGNPQAVITYSALLISQGLSPSDATIKNIDFDIVNDFTNKAADTADIYRTDQTFLLDQAGIKYTVLYPEDYGFTIYGDILATTSAAIEKDPNTVRKFTQATLKGWQYAVSHQSQALSMTAKYQNNLYKDPTYEKHILETSAPLIKPTGSQPIGSMQYVPWNRAYQAIESTGLVESDFNVGTAYTTEFVR